MSLGNSSQTAIMSTLEWIPNDGHKVTALQRDSVIRHKATLMVE